MTVSTNEPGLAGAAPPKHGPAVEHAYREIRDAIIKGRFGPSDRLGEEAIAKQLGVSRTPVREAFRRLEVEGLVEIKANSGVRVVQWSPKDIENAFEIRILLEARAAWRAASRITSEQLDEMRQLAGQIREQSVLSAEEESAIARRCVLNARFHEIFMRAADNEALRRTVEGITSFPLVKWNFKHLNADEIRRSDEQHFELLRAFEERDADWASAIMTSHILQARSSMLRRLPPHTDTDG